jgi:hypothetical protein
LVPTFYQSDVVYVSLKDLIKNNITSPTPSPFNLSLQLHNIIEYYDVGFPYKKMSGIPQEVFERT